MLHQLVPLETVLMVSLVEDRSSSLDDQLSKVLGENEGGIVTTGQHHSIEELLQRQHVPFDELGRRTDDLGGYC